MSHLQHRNDTEKSVTSHGLRTADHAETEIIPEPGGLSPKWLEILRKIEKALLTYNVEARGIKRVEPNERHDLQSFGYSQLSLLWFSFNLAANNITLGLLGPIIYHLSFKDACLCAVFGMILGSLPVAYIATFGPRSGCRSLVIARYTMGWWPAKLIVILNIIVLLGYGLIDAVVAGQIISAVSSHDSLSVVVGIIIVAVIAWLVTTFGYKFVHYYTRYAWIPQIIVFSILLGVAGPNFDVSAETSGTAATRIGDRLSFFSLCYSAAVTYAGGGADYYVYYPQSTPRWKVFLSVMAGLTLSFAYSFIVGVGLGSGVASNGSWSSAYNVSQGALIVQGFKPLGSFGEFCAVIVALGLIANLIPPTYSSGVDFQILGTLPARIPRIFWNTIGVLIYAICALVGRNNLAEIFTNFLALMGYWLSMWIAITLEEHYIFRRRKGFDWSAWNDRTKMPLGLAALTAFLVGWAGAILSMDQVWYIGPIAKLVGANGADMGNYIGFAWAALVFPPLRALELAKYNR